MPLNPEQQLAARVDRALPLKIIAGAGTGKTETLAARYVALVRSGIAPSRIVLLTFTEDAAAEMRSRVALRIAEASLDLPPHALLNLPIATFHGFAMRLLREHGFAIGLPPSPRLLSDDEQAELWQAVRDAIEAEPRPATGYAPLDHDTYRWDNDEAWNRALHVVSALRRGGGSPAELDPHPQLAPQQTTTFAPHRDQLVPLITQCFAAYTGQIRSRGVLDYDELLQNAIRLLRSVPALRDRWDVVMVDEFQDTNRPQLDLLRELQPQFDRTTVVGDPRQAIYGWNSARAESIYQFPFRADRAGVQQDLSANYRSDPRIVAVANLALAGSELGSLTPLAPAPERPPIRHPGFEGEPVVSLDLLPGVADEARLVAAEIGRLHARGIAFGEMAVLLRSRTELPALVEALRSGNIPFVLSGGSGLYLHPAVRLTSSLLRLLADPHDRAAWAHVLESPIVGLPPHVIALEAEPDADGRRTRLFERWIDDPTAVPIGFPDREAVVERLQAFHAWFAIARARWNLIVPAAYLDWLWQVSGITALADDDLQTALVLRHLLHDADDYAATHPANGIAGFAALLQQRVQTQPRVPLPTARVTDAVEIATVHQAKGREWPVVFVYHSALPGKRAGQIEGVLWDEQWRLVISDGNSKGKNDPLGNLRDDLRRRKRNEERSIWYVALTRAQQRLYILHSGCDLTDGEFVDAAGKLARQQAGQAADRDDEAVHFFHELWQRLRMDDNRLSDIVCRFHDSGDR